jgi:hypothetical protein
MCDGPADYPFSNLKRGGGNRLVGDVLGGKNSQMVFLLIQDEQRRAVEGARLSHGHENSLKRLLEVYRTGYDGTNPMEGLQLRQALFCFPQQFGL